jgi:hypothetical protein
MTEQDSTETIDPDELADAGPIPPRPIEFDPDAERANAAAASSASRAAFTPRRPYAPQRDPEAPVSPRRALIEALRDQFERDVERSMGRVTPVAVDLGSLADVALGMVAALPRVPDYHLDDSPRERFYDHRVPQLDPDEFYIPGGSQAAAVTTGAMPVGRSAAAERGWSDGVEVVRIPLRPAGAAEQDPDVVVELPLATAQAFAFAVLAATWADPVPDDDPAKD